MSEVVLFDPHLSAWVRYARPQAVFCLHAHEEIVPLLARLEIEVERRGLHAAGFLSYEAGAAFDPAMPRASCAPFPLAWFGLFDPPRPVDLPPAPPCPGLDWVPELDASTHAPALARIREFLTQGETYQVNFTYRQHADFSGDPWALFCRLAAAQPSPHGAYVRTGEFAVCCASPEMFFERAGDEVWSRPMKGTAPRGRWTEEDEARGRALGVSEKDRAENVMIVDMVRNDLGRVCLPGSVGAPELFRVERYPTLWQMTSLVRGRSTRTTAEIMAALFPAASITGAPKVRTMEIVDSLEISPRRIYTGTIGVMTPGRQARFNVAIRTALVDLAQGRAEYGVGGGIVWDSDPDAEYRETRIKARVLGHAPRSFQLLETMRWTRAEGVFLFDLHLRRLRASAAYFGYRLDEAEVRAALDRHVADLGLDACVLRLTLDSSGQVSVTHRPLPESRPCRIALAQEAVNENDPFLFHKTTNRDVYEAAIKAASGVDDVLLWNRRGEVTESTIANVVVELDGVRLTPALDCGLLPGVLRAHLLETGQVREAVIRVEDLARGNGLWLVSAVRGWRAATLVS